MSDSGTMMALPWFMADDVMTIHRDDLMVAQSAIADARIAMALLYSARLLYGLGRVASANILRSIAVEAGAGVPTPLPSFDDDLPDEDETAGIRATRVGGPWSSRSSRSATPSIPRARTRRIGDGGDGGVG